MSTPSDPRESCPECTGTGFTDASHMSRCIACGGSGLITPERLAEYQAVYGHGSEQAPPAY